MNMDRFSDRVCSCWVRKTSKIRKNGASSCKVLQLSLTREEFAQLVKDEVYLYAKAVQLPVESPQPSDDDWSEGEYENDW